MAPAPECRTRSHRVRNPHLPRARRQGVQNPHRRAASSVADCTAMTQLDALLLTLLLELAVAVPAAWLLLRWVPRERLPHCAGRDAI